MQQHEIKYSARSITYPLPLLPRSWVWGLIGQNSTFSKHGYVVYQITCNQIKWDHDSNMVEYILPVVCF